MGINEFRVAVYFKQQEALDVFKVEIGSTGGPIDLLTIYPLKNDRRGKMPYMKFFQAGETGKSQRRFLDWINKWETTYGPFISWVRPTEHQTDKVRKYFKRKYGGSVKVLVGSWTSTIEELV